MEYRAVDSGGLQSQYLKIDLWIVCTISLVTKIILSFIFHLIAETLGIKGIGTHDFNVLETIIFICVIGPLIEAVIVQLLVFELFAYMLRNNSRKYVWSIFATSLLFSLTHYDSFLHVALTFLSGLIYSGCYVFGLLKTGRRSIAFLLVAIIHISYNLSEFLFYGDY